MSVRTTADEKVDLAEESVKTAATALADICINECWGTDELFPERQLELRQCLNELLLIKARLRR